MQAANLVDVHITSRFGVEFFSFYLILNAVDFHLKFTRKAAHLSDAKSIQAARNWILGVYSQGIAGGPRDRY